MVSAQKRFGARTCIHPKVSETKQNGAKQLSETIDSKTCQRQNFGTNTSQRKCVGAKTAQSLSFSHPDLHNHSNCSNKQPAWIHS